MTQRASVFIGSSSEGLDIGAYIHKAMCRYSDAVLWTHGVFPPSYSTFESLLKIIEVSDFAVLALTPDDMTESRNQVKASPRDNVVFELGLFMGRLGRDRCYIVHDETVDLKLPTDLLGLTTLTFRPYEARNLEAELGGVCTTIKRLINDVGRRPKLLGMRDEVMRAQAIGLPSLSGRWAGFSPEGPYPGQQNSVMEIEQRGGFISATIVRDVKDGTRVFDYEGIYTSGQLVLFFEDRIGRGYIVGAVVLHLSNDLNRLDGYSCYYSHKQNKVVSTALQCTRVIVP
jgi:hypothetical protein